MKWPDEELTALLKKAPARALHELMCDCAAHALEVCEPIYRKAGFTLFPEEEPLAVKRRWLSGEASTDELASAQQGAVWHLYWGNPIHLGAAVLGAAWYPGGGLMLAEDEGYAESMTHYDSAAEAAMDVMREAVLAVHDLVYRSLYERDSANQEAAQAAQSAAEAEQRWQREHALFRGVAP